tara:strand:+ start:62 stop:223 length:162 start_codon:yes stop_codon:yes gene_type:complete
VESDFITRQEFQAFAKELREQLKAEIHHSRFEHERNKLISQGRWAPPLPEENK